MSKKITHVKVDAVLDPVTPKAKSPPPPRVVTHDLYDDLAFESIEGYDKIKKMCSDKNAKPIIQDVFTSFYRSQPEIAENATGLTKDILKEFHDMKEFKDFHETSMLDNVASSLGSCHMAPVLVEKIKEIEKKIEEQREKQREENKKNGKDPGDGIPDGPLGLGELPGHEQSGLRQVMREGLEKSTQDAQEERANMMAWGVDPAELKHMDPRVRLEMAEELKKAGKLKNVSELIGRFKNVISSTLATSPSHGSDEIVDIGPGNDLQNLVPTEILKLAESPLMFYKDMLESNLLCYNLKGTESLGKGPLIVIFDVSGSMQGAREDWAKAIVLALMGYAQKQRRAFGWISFAEKVYGTKFYNKDQAIPLTEKLEVASLSFTGGGTEFWSPLKAAMKAYKGEFNRADIVFITDGECRLQEKEIETFYEWRKEKDVRLFGIGISDRGRYGYGRPEVASFETLEQFSDQICMVNDLGEVSALKEAIGSVHKKRA